MNGAEREKEIVLEAERLEIRDKAPLVLAELLYDTNIIAQIKQHRSLFRRVCSSQTSERSVPKYWLPKLKSLDFCIIALTIIFTALHVMQTRYCDENSVCPSVTRVDCDKTVKRSVHTI